MDIKIKPWLWQAIGILLGIFLALLVVDKLYAIWQNFNPAVPKNTISMSAEGKVSAVPDLAEVSLGVTTTASTANRAQDDNSEKVNDVVKFVKSQGIDEKDIKTTQFSVYPQYDYSTSNPRITGYQATQTVTVKVRGVDKGTEKLGLILDGASDQGSNMIQGVYLTFDDPDNLRQEARKQALAKAKQKAEELAREAGLRLGKVVSVSESGGNYPSPYPYSMDSAVNQVKTAPSIAPGSQDITASVSVTFEVK